MTSTRAAAANSGGGIDLLGSLAGTIDLRLLVNYRVDAEAAAAVIPAPFQPKLVDGMAIGGICLIKLRLRPTWLPRQIEFGSFNGAHRFAVVTPDGGEGVYIPRRDSDSRVNTLLGGRLFPGHHHRASIDAVDGGDHVSVELVSEDDDTRVLVEGSTAEELPATSLFPSVQAVSDFFENGSLGYSDSRRAGRYDGLELRVDNWSVAPLAVDRVSSSFFDDTSRFPPGTVEFDNALIMRDIDHTWHSSPSVTKTTGGGTG
jgi:hypothetical protein